MVNYDYKMCLNMTKSFNKISCLIFAFCILPWSICMVDSAITDEDSKSKASYAATDDKRQEVSPSLLDSTYQRSRQSRCVTCYEDRRYGDDRSRYYSSYASRSGDSRSKSGSSSNYDRYDDRGYRGSEYDRYETDRHSADRYSGDRYGGDRYSGDRYAAYRDDYYGSRPYHDRYESRSRVPYERLPAYDRGESRGYGYDNRDRYYGGERGSSDNYGRDRYYERPRYGATGGSSAGYGGYDRDYYDRYSPREKSRYGGAGIKYYYDKGSQEDRRYLPETAFKSYSPCGSRRPNCPHNNPEGGTRVTSGTFDNGYYNRGVSQTTYNTNSNTKHNENTKGSTAGWSYVREDDQPPKRGSNSGSYASNSNNERQSSGYGALLDRGSNLVTVEPAKNNSNENANDSMASSDKNNDKNTDETPKHSDNGQNS